MTGPSEWAELRRAAGAALDIGNEWWGDYEHDQWADLTHDAQRRDRAFIGKASPATILALLDELDAQQATLRDVREGLLDMLDGDSPMDSYVSALIRRIEG